MRFVILTLLVAGALAAHAAAQSALFLAPESASADVGGSITLRAIAGEEPAPWPADHIGHFFARTAWTQENRDTVPALEGLETAAVWPAERPGVLLLGWDLRPGVETASADGFREFLERAVDGARLGALGVIPETGEVAIRHTQSAKALVRVEAAGSEPASVATSKTGQAVEIRPLMDPTALVPGSDFAVKIYTRLEGAAGGVVLAINTTTGEIVRSTTDDVAIANIHIEEAGRWRVEFHAVAPLNEEGASWDVHSATLTFDVVEEVNQ